MSRLETEGADASPWDMDIPTLLLELKRSLAIDTAILVLMALSESIHWNQHDDEVLLSLAYGRLNGHAVYEDDDGLIVRKVERPRMPFLLQASVSVASHSLVLKLTHQPQALAHPGVSKMFKTLPSQYYWTGMHQDSTKCLKQCPSRCLEKLK